MSDEKKFPTDIRTNKTPIKELKVGDCILIEAFGQNNIAEIIIKEEGKVVIRIVKSPNIFLQGVVQGFQANAFAKTESEFQELCLNKIANKEQVLAIQYNLKTVENIVDYLKARISSTGGKTNAILAEVLAAIVGEEEAKNFTQSLKMKDKLYK